MHSGPPGELTTPESWRVHLRRAQAEKVRRTHLGVALLLTSYALVALVVALIPDQHHDLVGGGVMIGFLLFVLLDGLAVRRWVRQVRLPPIPSGEGSTTGPRRSA